MKLFYKKVGDSFTLDEYNAMCYLLSLQSYSEVFDLGTESFTGEYGVYSFDDKNKVLMEKHDGFVILKNHKPITINITPYMPNATYILTLTASNNDKTLYSDNIESVVYYNELHDGITTDAQEKAETTQIQVKSKNNKITVVPKDLGLNNYDWIKKEITITAVYDKPILNWYDGGANTDSQIICETFSELKQAIHTCPENKSVDIRLKGRVTYKFDEEIVIKNKTVNISGGNSSNGSYATLDGQDKFRHFNVRAGSTLTIRNCHMINGNGSTVYTYMDSPKRGGSIYMSSNFITTDEGYMFNPSIVTIENCVFSDCHANRGGAIYNTKGKLSCNNVKFNRCKATKKGSKTACWGGAIMTESIMMYNDSSNQLHTDKSTTTYSDNTTIIDLQISDTQNLRNFINSNYTIPTLTCYYNDKTYTVTSVKTNQFGYLLTINTKLPVGSKFYLKCKDFTTHLLTVIKQNSSYYTIMVPDEVD